MSTFSFSRQFRSETGSVPSSGAAEVKAIRAEEKVQALSNDVERLLMITEALWGILKDQHGYTDEELARRVREIDLRDGRLDGRVASETTALCPSCKRPLERNRPYCIYCGQVVSRLPFER